MGSLEVISAHWGSLGDQSLSLGLIEANWSLLGSHVAALGLIRWSFGGH